MLRQLKIYVIFDIVKKHTYLQVHSADYRILLTCLNQRIYTV